MMLWANGVFHPFPNLDHMSIIEIITWGLFCSLGMVFAGLYFLTRRESEKARRKRRIFGWVSIACFSICTFVALMDNLANLREQVIAMEEENARKEAEEKKRENGSPSMLPGANSSAPEK